ncbi:MAG: cupredoxin domain-containing protein [Chloroflexi bacterium]|nr:cupredoxin domain-containing protein [Chloroflexota bacterium]
MRKQSAFLLVAFLVVVALSMAACGSKTPPPPTEVHVKMSEFKIEMDKTSIPAGPVKFIVENVGTMEHEAVLELAGDVDKPFEVNGKESEAPDMEPGKSATLEWTIDKPGQYQLACHVVGHYEAGMVTVFTVTAP